MRALLVAVWVATVAGIVASQDPAKDPKDPANKPEKWRMQGRVIDESGAPVEGACLRLATTKEFDTADVLRNPTARTGPDGRFDLECKRPVAGFAWDWAAQESCLITAPGRTAAWLYPAPWMGAASSSVARCGGVVLPRAISLRGRVRDVEGRPIAGARVIAHDALQGLTLPYSIYFDGSVATYVSYAVTDRKGVFTLPGVRRTGVRLSVSAEGFYRADLPFVTEMDPLLVELERGGHVEGRVLDDHGDPTEAILWVQYEVGNPVVDKARTRVKADGTFRVNLDHPHGYRVRTSPPRSLGMSETRSDVLRGPKSGVEVRAPGRGPGVRVRAVAADGGAAIVQASAAAVWMPTEVAGMERFMDQFFAAGERRSRSGGEIVLPGPVEGQPNTGFVMVRARGYAPFTKKGVQWDEDKPPVVEAALVRESVIAGVVVDRATGEPLPRALVFIGDANTRDQLVLGTTIPGRHTARTDARGRFRIGELGKAAHRVHAIVHGRPDAKPLTVKLGDAAEKLDVKLAVPAGVTLHGQLKGGEPRPGWRVRLTRKMGRGVGFFPGMADWANMREAEVGPDGSFTVGGLTDTTYDVKIIVRQGGDHTGSVSFSLESVRLRGKDLRRDFDVSDARLGRIAGKIVQTGSPLRPEQLAVIAFSTDKAAGLPARYGGGQRTVMRTAVRPDGRFALPVAPGGYKIEIIDMETGVRLDAGRDPVEVQPGEAAVCGRELELATVRVQLKPRGAGGRLALARLEVRVDHGEEDEPDEDLIMMGGYQGRGVSLARGEREVTLRLPVGRSATFEVHSMAQELLSEQGWAQPSPLAERKATPAAGEVNTVEIEVPAPTAEPGAPKRR